MASISEYIPVIPVEDKSYKFRRFGLLDIERIIRMATKVTTEGYTSLEVRLGFLREIGLSNSFRNEDGTINSNAVNAIMMNLSMALGVVEIREDFVEFMTKALYKTDPEGQEKQGYVTAEELLDPDVFPAYSWALLVLNIIMHPDFELLKQAVVEGSKIPFGHRALEELRDTTEQEFAKAFENLPPKENQ